MPRRKTRSERVREIRAERDSRSANRARDTRGGTQYANRSRADRTRTGCTDTGERRRAGHGAPGRQQRGSSQQTGRERSAHRQRQERPRKRSSRGPSVPLRILALLLAVVVLVLAARVVRRIASGLGPDKTAPVITLNHDPDYTVMPGQLYKEEGYTATDDRDGDLTDRVERIEEEDRIRYRVSDSAGNVTVSYREIPWMPGSDPSLADAFYKDEDSEGDSNGTGGGANGKVIYLTFDDGPGQYTQRLLDILEKNDVRATFFVTGAFPVYEDLIKAEYEAGHSIGIHTFCHDYDKIYASTDAFWEDNNKMQEIIVRQTGVPTSLMRFAGGSSNTMGTWQVPDIMEQLAKQARERKLQYFDWNVSSGDGAAEGDSAMVISRITDQIRNQDESVVLCHDTKEYTVNAMEYLIPWLIENGYEIRPLTAESFPAHHIEPD